MADWGTRVLRGLRLHELAEYKSAIQRKCRDKGDQARSAKAPERAVGRKLATLKGVIQFERYQGCGIIDHT